MKTAEKQNAKQAAPLAHFPDEAVCIEIMRLLAPYSSQERAVIIAVIQANNGAYPPKDLDVARAWREDWRSNPPSRGMFGRATVAPFPVKRGRRA